EAGKVDQNRGPQTRSDIGRTARKIPVLLMIRERESDTQLLVELVYTMERFMEPESGQDRLHPQVVLLVDHDADCILRTHEEARSARWRLAREAGQLTRYQVAFVEQPAAERRHGGKLVAGAGGEGGLLDRAAHELQDLLPLTIA